MSPDVRPFLLGPGEGAPVANPLGGEIVSKLEGAQCAGAATVFETAPPSGEGPPMHFHEAQDEWIHVLDGTFRLRFRDEIIPAPAGSFVFLPRRFPHTDAFRDLAAQPGMVVVGPPLAQSHPLPEAGGA